MGSLWGTYDEAANAASFQEAVADFRSAMPGARSSQGAVAAAIAHSKADMHWKVRVPPAATRTQPIVCPIGAWRGHPFAARALSRALRT